MAFGEENNSKGIENNEESYFSAELPQN